VDGLGEVGAARLVQARPPRGYRDLADLCKRSKLPRKLVENLILAGAMVDWTPYKRNLLWELGRLRYQEEELPLPLAPDEVALEPMSSAEEMLYEYSVTGVSAQGHLMELWRGRLERSGVIGSQDLQRARGGQMVRVAGLVAVRQAPPTAKGFVFYTLEDEGGLMNIIVRPDVFQAQRQAMVGASILAVEGAVQRSMGRVNVLAERAWRIR